MIDGFEMLAEGFAANRDAVLDHFGGFTQRQGIPLDRVRCIGQFKIMDMLKVAQSSGRKRTEPIELRLLLRDLFQKFVHDLFWYG